MKKFSVAVTAAILIGTVTMSAVAEAATPRQELCRSLQQGILSGNVSAQDAVIRLRAYDSASRK